jgi:hypothetical protein
VPGVDQDVAVDSANMHPSFCAVEALVEAADVSMDFDGVIVAPATRELLRSTPSFPDGSIGTWAEIRGGQSSPQVTGGKAFCGCWNNMTFCLWGRGIELLVDPLSSALNTKFGSLQLCSPTSPYAIRPRSPSLCRSHLIIGKAFPLLDRYRRS